MRRSRRRRLGATLLLALALGLGGCAEEALPERRLTVDDCLTTVELDRLETSLRRCDRVVAAYPRDPQPLNERFLLHSLRGDEVAACRDIRKAATLAHRIPPRRLDPLLRRELDLRLASCRDELPATSRSPQPAGAPAVPAAAPQAATTPGGVARTAGSGHP